MTQQQGNKSTVGLLLIPTPQQGHDQSVLYWMSVSCKMTTSLRLLDGEVVNSTIF